MWNSRDKNGGKIKYILCIYENVAVELTECYKKTRSRLPSSICFLFSVCGGCMCVYLFACIWAHVFAGAHAHGKCKVDVGNGPPYLLHLTQRESLNQTPSLSRWLVLFTTCPGYPVSAFWVWNYRQAIMPTWHLYGFWGSKPWSSPLHAKHLTTEISHKLPCSYFSYLNWDGLLRIFESRILLFFLAPKWNISMPLSTLVAMSDSFHQFNFPCRQM